MVTKANEASESNNSLFTFSNQPLKRTSSTAVPHTAPQRTSSGLMEFSSSPTSDSVKPEPTDEIPNWAKAPSIQAFITYTNPSGLQQKLHVVPWTDLHTQNIELQTAIKEIRQAGGTPKILEVINVQTATCISRQRIA